MPEYVRKKRYLTYSSPLCKKYLRFDFRYECAYCGRHEAESIDGPDSYEIDHFKPHKRFSHEPNINNYDNLFYSCQLCNGKTGKSDKWHAGLLNPCINDIYGDENTHHILRNHDSNFKLISKTPEGDEYIKVFNLNQQRHRHIRKSREKYRKQFEERKSELEKEIDKRIRILNEIENKNKTIDLSKEKDILEQELNDIKKRIVGAYYYNIEEIGYFDEVYEYSFERVLCKDVAFRKTYGEYGLHYDILFSNQTFKGYLRIIDGIQFNRYGNKQIRIPNEQVEDWISLDENIIVFVFDCHSSEVYYLFFNDVITNKEANNAGSYYVVDINIHNRLSNGFTNTIMKILNSAANC